MGEEEEVEKIRMRTHDLPQATGEIERWTEAHPLFAHAYMDKGRVLWASLSRPTVLLTRSAICGLLCLYMAL